jgi:chemotaxis receptor (MCP) glutamine deamidase CheD
LAQGYKEFAVSIVDLPLKKEKALNIALNKISGDWDEHKLALLLDELTKVPEFDVGLTGFETEEISELLDRALNTDPSGAKEENFDVEEAHTMLPSKARYDTDYEKSISASLLFGASSSGQRCMVAERTSVKAEDAKYIDVAIDKMLRGLYARGAKREDLEAKLIGGSNMFPSLMSDDIGKANVLSARDKLKSEGIRIVGECVGGAQGRSVEFSPTTGVVAVKTKF